MNYNLHYNNMLLFKKMFIAIFSYSYFQTLWLFSRIIIIIVIFAGL